jgi:hypothetical protein
MEECMRKVFNKKEEQALDKIHEEDQQGIKNRLKQHETDLRKTTDAETVTFLKNAIRLAKRQLQSSTMKQKKQDRKERIRKTYCNPGCKDTIFEPGDPNQLPKSFIRFLNQENKRNKSWKHKTWNKPDMHLAERKKIFGNQTNVLENGFYKGLDKKTIKRLKARGAISGCEIQKKYYPLLQT